MDWKGLEMKVVFTWLVALTLLGFETRLVAQPGQGGSGGVVRGSVFDSTSGSPIEYANIVLFSGKDSTQTNGTITTGDGTFEIQGVRPGRYFADVMFMGFIGKRVNNVRMKPGETILDLGRIDLVSGSIEMEKLIVEGERLPISFEIDKKVIHVDQQTTVVSGTAVDVLQNVPSVTVDIEGNVSLRGSGSFLVLVDGRPSILDPNDALQQIPASTIEDIEIVTNPSAKYDPSGTSGIINIVLKKNETSGKSGLVNLNAGFGEKYGGDGLWEYGTSRYKITLAADYNRQIFAATDRAENRTTLNNQTFFVDSKGESERGRISGGARAEILVMLGKRNHWSFGANAGDRGGQHNGRFDYDEWSGLDPLHLFYTSKSDRERSGFYYSLNSSFVHRFLKNDHELSADLFYRFRDSDETTTNKLFTTDDQIVSGQKSTETGPGQQFRAKVDYVLPTWGEDRFEAGYQSDLNLSEDDTRLLLLDPNSGFFVLQPQFTNLTDYSRNIQAAYVLYSGYLGQLGLKGGLRAEYTDRTVKSAAANKQFTIDRWDYFPTAHASYKLPGNQQVMASYSRRIERPRGWHLEPFETWIDAYNVRVGNPGLKPEYIDSYEAGYQRFFGTSLFSVEGYYRIASNKTERVRSPYSEDVTLQTIENVGKDYAAGMEVLLNLDVTQKWTLNLMGNAYEYKVEGALLDEPFSRSSFNWTFRANNTFKLSAATGIQLDALYDSPTASSQGEQKGYFTINAAVRHEFIKNRLSATVQIRDVLSTARFESSTEGQNFFASRYSDRESPVLLLNVRYAFNKANKKERPARRSSGQDEPGGDDF